MGGRTAVRLAGLSAAVLLLASVLAAGMSSVVQAAVSGEAASREIAERFGVEVLKVAPGEVDGRKVWLVTVMQPGGNSNGAFRVHVLAVDQESGALVPSFRHHASGATLPPAAPGASRP